MANESQAKMKARAKDLVLNANGWVRSTSWHTLLSDDDKEYVSEVIKAFKNQPEAQLQYVAASLQIELNISVSVSTVARTLREIIRNEEKTKQD